MIRFLGATLIVACAAFVHMLGELEHTPPLHQISGGELLLALVVVVTGLSGVIMMVAGEKLFAPPE